jgi:hypothetical protein
MAHDTADHKSLGRASRLQCKSQMATKEPRVGAGDSACEKTGRQLFDEFTAYGFCHRLRAVSHLQEGKQAPHVFLDGAQTPVHLHTDSLITQPPGKQTQEFTLNGTQCVHRMRRLRRG